MRRPATALLLALAGAGPGLSLAGPVSAAPACTFLRPIGATGPTPIVAKRVGRDRLLGRTNWNTDFTVDAPYTSFKFFFTATSTEPTARYPISGFMKFSDGSSLRLFEERLRPPLGQGRMFGPFPAVPGKQVSQINFKIGASDDPTAVGFSYRISVQGCR